MEPANNMSPFETAMLRSYGKLMDRWYDAAAANDNTASKKLEIIGAVDRATKAITDNMSTNESKAKAKQIASIILNSFASHSEQEWASLSEWMSNNTLQIGKDTSPSGAYGSFHRLLESIKTVVKDPSYDGLFAIAEKIDMEAKTTLNLNVSAYENKNKGDKVIFPKEIMHQIITEATQGNVGKDFTALKTSSKEMDIQVVHTYQGPLKKLNITTADQAIEFAQKYGEGLHYINISGIDFSDSSKLQDLLNHLPNLTKLIARSCKIDKDGVEIIIKTKSMLNVTELQLGENNFGKEEIVKLAKCPFLINLKGLDYAMSQIRIRGVDVKLITPSQLLKNISTFGWISDNNNNNNNNNIIENGGVSNNLGFPNSEELPNP